VVVLGAAQMGEVSADILCGEPGSTMISFRHPIRSLLRWRNCMGPLGQQVEVGVAASLAGLVVVWVGVSEVASVEVSVVVLETVC